MAHDVFISYSTKNKQVADAVCNGLEQRKIRCWIAPRDVPPGGNYGEAIIHAISGCRVVVLIYSSAVNLSAAVMREAERAMHHAKPIIPFRLEDVPMQPGLEFFLASCHWLDAIHPPLEDHIQRLGDAVESFMGREIPQRESPPAAPPPPAKRAPWLPLAAGGLLLTASGITAAILLNKPGEKSPAGGDAPIAAASPAVAPSLDIALAGAAEEVIAGHFRKPPPGAVRYLSSRDGDTLSIHPERPEGVPLLAADSQGRRFSVEPPQIELKIAHTGPGTIYIHTATLEVESSAHDSWPLWYLTADDLPASVSLTHAGSAPMPGATLRHTLAGPEDSGELPDPPIPLPDSGVWHLPLEPGKTLLGEIAQPGAAALSFELPSNPRTPSPPPPARAPRAPASPLALKEAGARYEAAVNVSHYLRSGEGDRFFLTLSAPCSSRHRFRVVLGYDDGSGPSKQMRSGPVELLLFRER